MTALPLPATFARRENRFVLTARLDGGEQVRAYLPNTARLHDVLVPGVRLLLEPTADPARRTRYTATRVAAGSAWVSLEAGRATDHLVEHLRAGGSFPGAERIVGVEREVAVGPHRIDLRLGTPDGDRWLVEVKSLSRSVDGTAPLSTTPSTRGVSQLATLAREARRGGRCAVSFVVQRGDVDRLEIGPHADPTWVHAVREAAASGVVVAAYRCSVQPREVTIDREIPVRFVDGADRT